MVKKGIHEWDSIIETKFVGLYNKFFHDNPEMEKILRDMHIDRYQYLQFLSQLLYLRNTRGRPPRNLNRFKKLSHSGTQVITGS